MKPLSGKVALITGASAPRGIGRAIALRLAQDGAFVVVTDMHAAANQRLAMEDECTIDEIKQKRYAGVALRDAGLPEDVAEAVAYLAGPTANYVTGINLPVSGGVPCGI